MRTSSGLCWAASILLSACAPANSTPVEGALAEAPLTAAELQGQPLIGLALPTTAGDLESLIRTPQGYAAYYRKILGQGKVSLGTENTLFVSADGLHWTPKPIPDIPTWVSYRSLAYGAGRFVLAGSHNGQNTAAVLSSVDGETWQDVPTDMNGILQISFVNERFFALGQVTGIYSSPDGIHFTGGRTNGVQVRSIAYGDGTYVTVSNSALEVSHDGESWRAVSVDRSEAPVDTSRPSFYQGDVLFAEGSFYSEGVVSSDNGESWQPISRETPVPEAYDSGWFLNRNGSQLSAWRDGESAVSATISDDNPDQLNCLSHHCLLLSDGLLLVP